MKPSFALGYHAALLLSVACLDVSPAVAEAGLGEIARHAFAEFQKQAPEMSAPGKSSPTVTVHPTFWQCSDGQRVLSVDLRGNACYMRVRGWLPNLASDGKAVSSLATRSDDDALVQKGRELAMRWLSPDEFRTAKPSVKRETLLLAQLPGGRITEIPGRTIVRLIGPDDIGYGCFQAVFNPTGDLLRVDISFANARTKEFCNRALLRRLPASKTELSEAPLTLGCFFDPSEYRFEISAFAVEGESFLNPDQASNPFSRDNFDLKAPHRVSVERYRNSQDYHWWCWAWWHHYGCVGAFRGN